MNKRFNKKRPPREPKEFDEKVIQISRVSKKTKGGNKIGFSVLMVVGDKKGRVGVGLGKAGDVVSAIKKGVKKAKKKMITVPLNGTTIPFALTVKKGAGKVMLKPAPQGSGVIAGGPVRSVVEAAGVRDISAKILGSKNQASSVYATFEALRQIGHIVKVRGIQLKSIEEIVKEDKAKKRAKESEQKVTKSLKKVVKSAKPTGIKPAKKVVAKKVVVKKAAKVAKPAAKVAKTKAIKPVAKKSAKATKK